MVTDNKQYVWQAKNNKLQYIMRNFKKAGRLTLNGMPMMWTLVTVYQVYSKQQQDNESFPFGGKANNVSCTWSLNCLLPADRQDDTIASVLFAS